MSEPRPPKSPIFAYLSSDDRERPGWRLFVYLVLSYGIAWLAHLPIYHDASRAVIPAALPWLFAAAVAIRQYRKGLSRRPAWLTLAIASAVLILPHLLLQKP